MIDASKIIIALDSKDEKELDLLLSEIKDHKVWLKIGMEFFYFFGPQKIQELANRGHPIFLDLKLHDIPNTVYEALLSLSKLPIQMINIHCSGGLEMMMKAKEAITKFQSNPLLIGVTILTSFSEEAFKQSFPGMNMRDYISHQASLAKIAGLDGVVCSPLEISMIKEACGADFKTVTPGIRFDGQNLHDQKRTMNALETQKIGGDFMVIGRPITKALSPRLALEKILKGENP